MKTLIIDNYDSFVYNIAQYVGELNGNPITHRNDRINLSQVMKLKPSRIILSPGPGTPENPRDFGICSTILQHISSEVPTLGICLGHQGIVYAFSGKITRAKRLLHGKTSLIKHDGKGIFKGIRNPLQATRYHSLVADKASIPPCLKITAESVGDGEVMGVRHTAYPIEGVQFHPESILSEDGKKILKNFLGV